MSLAEVQYSDQELTTVFCAPAVLVSLLEACLDGDQAQSLAAIILQDGALAARVVQAACKAGSGEIDPAEPVSSAIQALGLPALTRIALQAARQLCGEDFSAAELQFLQRLWFLSRATGQAAACVAPAVNYPRQEEAQLAGALLTLGHQLLFVRYRQAYVKQVGDPLSSVSLCRREDELFAIDHLRLTEAAIAGWHLESFLLDAVRFLHVDCTQVEQCSPLVRLTRLAFQLCSDGEQLTEKTRQLGQQLFGFQPREVKNLFAWAQELWGADLLPTSRDLQRTEFSAQLAQLNQLLLSLIAQDGVRARLAVCRNQAELIAQMRKLYLEESFAGEAIFLLLDQGQKQLRGMLVPGQARLVGELDFPLDGATSLAAQSLLKGSALDSLLAQRPLAVTDQVFQRLCGRQQIFCQPLLAEGRMLGVIVLGFETEQELRQLRSLHLQMVARLSGEALLQLPVSRAELASADSRLLQRVSHELGNPLTIIGNYAGVLDRLLAGTENAEIGSAIKAEIGQIDAMLSGCLPPSKAGTLSVSGVCLNQLVRDLSDLLAVDELELRKINLQLDLQERLGRISTNALLVKQVLVSLVRAVAVQITAGGVLVLQTRDSFCADGMRYVDILVQEGRPSKTTLTPEQPAVQSDSHRHGQAKACLELVKSTVDGLDAQISYYGFSGVGTGFCLRLPSGDSCSQVG